VVVLVHRCLRVRLAIRERDPLDLQRDAGWRGDLARVAHGDLYRCTCGPHAKLSSRFIEKKIHATMSKAGIHCVGTTACIFVVAQIQPLVTCA
jgi:hypothetical protein